MPGPFEEQLEDICARAKRGLERERTQQLGGASIFIPLLPGEGGIDVLFEVRALHLKRQPGEVCFPGGHLEPGESPRDAAIRETAEELLVAPSAVRIICDLGEVSGPGGMPIWVYAGTIDSYAGTFDPTEVDRVFTVPLAWFESHEPHVYCGVLQPEPPADFPWELIPQGRNYPWRLRKHETTFYRGTDPLIWGFTARMMHRFITLLTS